MRHPKGRAPVAMLESTCVLNKRKAILGAVFKDSI
jgi:hypothetical protein